MQGVNASIMCIRARVHLSGSEKGEVTFSDANMYANGTFPTTGLPRTAAFHFLIRLPQDIDSPAKRGPWIAMEVHGRQLSALENNGVEFQICNFAWLCLLTVWFVSIVLVKLVVDSRDQFLT